jgi:hypothetical protein
LNETIQLYPGTRSELFALYGKVSLALNGLSGLSLAQSTLAVLQEKYPTNDLTQLASVLVSVGTRPSQGQRGSAKKSPHGEPVNGEQLPNTYSLSQNYPNPFNPSTRIEYSIPKDGHVLLGVFDILGRQVAVLESGVKPAGSHSVTFDASGLASGVYLYRLEVDRFTIVREMLVVK